MRLLLAEDDKGLADVLSKELRQCGYAVDVVDNGVDAEFMGDEVGYGAVILDLGLPARSGLEVLQNWRQSNNKLPVLILTARDDWSERVAGLRAGADDYLGKPFHFEELKARLEALLRRAAGQVGHFPTAAGLTLDTDQYQVIKADGTAIPLTAMEFRLLKIFMLNPGKILSKNRLIEQLYDDEGSGDSNVLEVYIHNLREKLHTDAIRTHRGRGYQLIDPGV